MRENDEGEVLNQVSKATATVRYDGPALAEHSMDVADLAPALLGLSEIVKIANKKFNGDRSAVKVLVNVDREQRCFQCDIQITQGLFHHLSLLLSSENIATAKDILEWIGIIGGGPGGIYGLFRLYKWITNKNVSLNELVACTN